MCGIAGILGRVDDDNRQALLRMTDAIAHRGPDSAGFWTSEPDAAGAGCLFGHRRLSIIDLSCAADQPMTDPHGGQTIIFNGEIYNFRALRADLEARRETFQSTGDTAVMLRALALDGPDAIARLRGMFAFAMWDPAARRLVLGRDPLGIKPLYVCRNPDAKRDPRWSMLFASEVRAILASGFLPKPRLNRQAVKSVIWNGFVVGPETAVNGIESLEPGEVRVVNGCGTEQVRKRYWRMPPPDEHEPIGERQMRDALAESVKLHLIADVPLGIFLSGGVDSSAVANLAQRASSVPVNTFTLAFEESQYDEGRYARAVAEAIGSRHHEILLTESQFTGAISTAIDTIDQPTFDGLNSYYISKAVREAGLTVALVGTGGDELFGGYASFRAIPTMLRWQRRSRMMPAVAKAWAAHVASKVLAPSRGSTPAQTRWAKLTDMVRAGDDVVALYQLAYALFLPSFQDRLLLNGDQADASHSGLGAATLERLEAEIRGQAPLRAISILEQRLFLGERLLRDTDAASMAVSLETRLPLVDSVLVERANRLDESSRYFPLGRKRVLRKIGLAGLDPALFDRPKSGFVMPFDHWIRRSLGKEMAETMRDERAAAAVGLNGRTVAQLWSAFQDGAPGLYWSRVWALYVLIRWCHRHRVLL